MAILTKVSLKEHFERAKQPTSANFSDVVDTMIKIPVSAGLTKSGFIETETTADATAHKLGTFNRGFLLDVANTVAARDFLAITSASAGGGGAAGQAILNSNVTASVVSQLGADTVGTALLQATTTASVVDSLGNTVGNIIQTRDAFFADHFSSPDLIPVDDSLPLNTEGTAVGTMSFTPTDVNSNIIAEAVLNVAVSGAATITGAMFFGTRATAVAVGTHQGPQGSTNINRGQIILRSVVSTIGTTGNVNVSARIGTNVANNRVFLNGGAGREFASAMQSSIKIMEIKNR